MLGVGVSANGLDGASSDPSDGTAADLTANRQSTGNGSAQLSVDDLASGSHDPAMQGMSANVATAPIQSASLPLFPQTTSPTSFQGYASVPMPGSNEITFNGAAAPFVPSQMYPAAPNYGQQLQQAVSTAPVVSLEAPDQAQIYSNNGYPAAAQMQPGYQQQFQQIPQQTSVQLPARSLSPVPLFVAGQQQGQYQASSNSNNYFNYPQLPQQQLPQQQLPPRSSDQDWPGYLQPLTMQHSIQDCLNRMQVLKTNVWPAHVLMRMERELLAVMQSKQASMGTTPDIPRAPLSAEMAEIENLVEQQQRSDYRSLAAGSMQMQPVVESPELPGYLQPLTTQNSIKECMDRAAVLRDANFASLWPDHVLQRMERELLAVMQAKRSQTPQVGFVAVPPRSLSPEMQMVEDLLNHPPSLEQVALNCQVPAVPTMDLLSMDVPVVASKAPNSNVQPSPGPTLPLPTYPPQDPPQTENAGQISEDQFPVDPVQSAPVVDVQEITLAGLKSHSDIVDFISKEVKLLPDLTEPVSEADLREYFEELETEHPLLSRFRFFLKAFKSKFVKIPRLKLRFESALKCEAVVKAKEGLEPVFKTYHENLLLARDKTRVQTVDYSTVYAAFVSQFLNRHLDNWDALHRVVWKHPSCVQGSDELFRDFVMVKVRAQDVAWKQSGLSILPPSFFANRAFAGMRDFDRIFLMETYPEVVDPSKLGNWSLDEIAARMDLIEGMPMYRRQKAQEKRLNALSGGSGASSVNALSQPSDARVDYKKGNNKGKEYFKSTLLSGGEYKSLNADQQKTADRIMHKAWSDHAAGVLSERPAANGSCYYLNGSNFIALCIRHPNAAPGIKSCAGEGKAQPGHFITQCSANGTANVAEASPSKKGRQQGTRRRGNVGSVAVNSKGEPISGERLRQSQAAKAGVPFVPDANKENNGAAGKSAKAEKKKLAAEKKKVEQKHKSLESKVNAIQDLLPEIASTFADAWTDKHDADEVNTMNGLKKKLQALSPVVTHVVNLQTDCKLPSGQSVSPMSCVVDFMNFCKCLIDSGARHNVASLADGERWIASGKAEALLPRDESIRFQSASGDEMQYVNDLPVCIRIGDEEVTVVFKLMRTMPAGHLPILGTRGQRSMNGDLLNSRGVYVTNINGDQHTFQVDYGDGDWLPEKRLRVQLNDRVERCQGVAASVAKPAYAWDPNMMVIAVLGIACCALVSLNLCCSLLDISPDETEVVLFDRSVDPVIEGFSSWNSDGVNATVASGAVTSTGFDWHEFSELSVSNELQLCGSQYLDVNATTTVQFQDQIGEMEVTQTNITNCFGECVAISVDVTSGEPKSQVAEPLFEVDSADACADLPRPLFEVDPVLACSDLPSVSKQTLTRLPDQWSVSPTKSCAERSFVRNFINADSRFCDLYRDAPEMQEVWLREELELEYKLASMQEQLQVQSHVKSFKDKQLALGPLKERLKKVKMFITDCRQTDTGEWTDKPLMFPPRRRSGTTTQPKTAKVNAVASKVTSLTGLVSYKDRKFKQQSDKAGKVTLTARAGKVMRFRLAGRVQAGVIYQNVRLRQKQPDGDWKERQFTESWVVSKKGSSRKIEQTGDDFFLIPDDQWNAGDGEVQFKTEAWFEAGSVDSSFKKESDKPWGLLRGRDNHQREVPANVKVLFRDVTVRWLAGIKPEWSDLDKFVLVESGCGTTGCDGAAAPSKAISSKSGMDHRFKDPKAAQQRRLESVTDARMRRRRAPSDDDWNWTCEAGDLSDEESGSVPVATPSKRASKKSKPLKLKRSRSALLKQNAVEWSRTQNAYESGELSEADYQTALTKLYDLDYGTVPGRKVTFARLPSRSNASTSTTAKRRLGSSTHRVMDAEGYYGDEDRSELQLLSEVKRQSILSERKELHSQRVRRSKLRQLAAESAQRTGLTNSQRATMRTLYDRQQSIASKCCSLKSVLTTAAVVSAVNVSSTVAGTWRADGELLEPALQPGLCPMFDCDTRAASSVSYMHEGRTSDSIKKLGNSLFELSGCAESEWANLGANKGVLESAFRDYSKVFEPDENGKLRRALNEDGTLYEASIDLVDDRPVRSPKYTMSPVMLKIVHAGVIKMIDDGVVSRSRSHYSSNCLPVEKPGTSPKEWRIVIDLRDVNAKVLDDCYPAMTEFDVHHKLYGMKRFSSLDLRHWYWQISLDEASKKCTGFHVPGLGSFQYDVMPMGVKSACAVGQALAEDVLRFVYDGPGPHNGKIGLSTFCIVWMDDILIYDEDTPYHAHYVAWVLKRLAHRNIQAAIQKVKLGVPRIGFIGHYLDKDGLHCDPAKQEAIRTMAVPHDVASLRRLLGMCQYLSRFVHRYAVITAPLSDLLQSTTKFEMTAPRLKAVEDLKQAITSAPVLALPDFGRHFVIRCDASMSVAIGGTLNQVFDGQRRPICNFGRKIRDAECNYGIRDLECKALHYCFRKSREYIQGKNDTVVMTDHRNLLYLKNAQPSDRRLFNAACELSCYPFTLVHCPGELLNDADCISRSCTLHEDATSDDDDVNGPTDSPSLDKVEVVPTESEARHLVGVETSVPSAKVSSVVPASTGLRQRRLRSGVGAVQSAVTDIVVSVDLAIKVVSLVESRRVELRRLELHDTFVQFRGAVDLNSYGKILQKSVVDFYPTLLSENKMLEGRLQKKPRSSPARLAHRKDQASKQVLNEILDLYERAVVLDPPSVSKRTVSELQAAPVQPDVDGKYNVFVADAGLNAVGQALAGSEYKIVGGTSSNSDLSKLFKLQTGLETLGSTASVLHDDSELSGLPKVHVLAAVVGETPMPVQLGEKPELQKLRPADVELGLMRVVQLATKLQPQALMVQIPPADGLEAGAVQALEAAHSALSDLKYDVTDDILNAAQHGDYVSAFVGVLVAVKQDSGLKLPPFVFPEALKRFAGLSAAVSPDAPVRMRAKSYQNVKVVDHGVFEPLQMGTVSRAASTSGLYRMSHPLPELSGSYSHSGTNGSSWLWNEERQYARLLTQEQMASCMNMDSVTKMWLMNQPKLDVQRYLATSAPVSVMVRMFEALLPRLRAVTTQANSPRQTSSVSAVTQRFADSVDKFGDSPSKAEVDEFDNAYSYVGAVVTHAFPSLQTIKEEQQKEADIADVVKFLQLSLEEQQAAKVKLSGHYSKSDLRYMKVRDGVLFYSNEYGTGEVLTDAIVLPKSLQKRVLRALHDSPFHGHAGMRATLLAMRERVFWNPHMVRDIRKYVRDCAVCRKAKAHRCTHAGLQKRQFFWGRHECMGVDLLGKFVAVDGMTHVCHVTDFATGFNFCIPIPDKEAVTVAAVLHKHVFMFAGWPKKLVSDQGGEFCNKLQKVLASDKYGYVHLRTCSFSPQGNSHTEGRHRHMNAMFKICVRKYRRNWVDGLTFITWCLNTRPYRDTEYTPYQLYFGQPPPTMADAALDPNAGQVLNLDYKSFLSPEQWLRNMELAVRDAIVIVNNAKLVMANENARAVEGKRYEVYHAPGSLVNVSRPITKKGETSRLLYQTMGPFEVVGQTSQSANVCKLKHLGTGKIQSFNVRDIMPFISKEAYEREIEEQQEEKKADDEEVKTDDDFDPQPGDFCLFPNFQDVDFHLVQVVSRPFPDEMTVRYYGVPKTNKKRLTGYAKVWTHDSKPEVQMNADCKLKDYKLVSHELMVADVCQKVIVPVLYSRGKKDYYKLKAADVKDVLKYRALM